MKTTLSYGMEIRNQNKIFLPTINVYQKALTFCIRVVENEWVDIEPLTAKYRNAFVEHLVHSTKSNKAKYIEFDTMFHKLPIYLLRDIVSQSIGVVSSYHSNLKNWIDSGKIGSIPRLQTNHRKFPTFYKPNMSNTSELTSNKIRLKLFIDNDWKFVNIRLKPTDVKYITKNFDTNTISNPILEKRYNKWFIRFVGKEDSELKTKSISERTVLAVDLGINTDATCSVMRSDGTIHARKFINFRCDKDRIYHCLNKIKGIQHKYGSKGTNTNKLWRYVKSLNDELARKIANAITDYAISQNVDIIVFEHLDSSGRKHGKNKQKLSMWKKNTIQKIVEQKAHRHGIRVSRICAWKTSKLAFDGSGMVVRGKDAGFETCELCKFQNGKIYNCDLSASYNIGARYFIRELQKSISVTKWSDISAKVPNCQKRTLCTYSTLVEVAKLI